MQQRDDSLDALRGLAILAMVLSSSIAFGILPAWMYHAQEPPPTHIYRPELPGISWVDLVFPFFLFSMGAAIPLALNKKRKEEAGWGALLSIAVRRYLLLVFFALFTMHARSAVVTPTGWLLQLGAFALLCFMLYKPVATLRAKIWVVIRILAFIAAALMMYLMPLKSGKGFSLFRSDIIILVLANMAFFATIIWWCTKDNPWRRIGLLPFIMAILLGAGITGSLNEAVFQWSPLPWMYKCYYLKYLFLLIPGTFAGEWILIHAAGNVPNASGLASAGNFGALAGLAPLLSFTLIVTNVIFLFSRQLLLNMGVTVAISLLLFQLLRSNALLFRFFKAGVYLLLLGFFFEAYEGGIKKDPSTFSYYFVTAGLAFFMLITLYGCQLTGVAKGILRYLSLHGRNPMVAYVTGNLLLLPLLRLSGAITYYTGMQSNIAGGFLSGVLFTGIVSGVTVFFTKRKWLWKT
ncbi:DUF5009 domain-containing protein [Chitinophaga sp. 30R24]|uniref:DUF5009 domain-containing protein n=1 Tax=Chitinophaga sp. 30R24 TaxID=3248838 RepID=UPI003B8FFB6C